MPARVPAHSWVLPQATVAWFPVCAMLHAEIRRIMVSPAASGRTPGCLSAGRMRELLGTCVRVGWHYLVRLGEQLVLYEVSIAVDGPARRLRPDGAYGM